MNKIPNHIKNKVQDIDWSNDFIFEVMPCTHKQDAKEYEKVNCNKCNFDKREQWLENTLEKQEDKETITVVNDQKKSITKTLAKITVMRGKFDDCIGIQKDFA